MKTVAKFATVKAFPCATKKAMNDAIKSIKRRLFEEHGFVGVKLSRLDASKHPEIANPKVARYWVVLKDGFDEAQHPILSLNR